MLADADALERELRNWGRWAASWREHLGVPEPVYCAGYRAGAAWDPGWGDRDAAPESLPPPIDEGLALLLDAHIRRLARSHLLVLRRHYADRLYVNGDVLGAAVRALGDVMTGIAKVH